jgi:regulator of protease activity HflC (stomatin/prohibitin superfamily)
MERNIQKNGLVNLVMLLLAGVAAFVVARVANSLAGQVAAAYLGLGTLVAAVSWFQMRLEESERLEKLEVDELARSHGASALFETKEAELFPAQRSREQFERFFVPVFTVLLCASEGIGAFLLWRWLASPALATKIGQPMVGMFLFALISLVLFLLGRFSATFARLENQRLLRPGASWLLVNAILCGAVSAGIIGVQAGFPKTDLFVGRALCVVLGLVSVETLITLVLEIYRPRVKGKVERPLYESRLVGLLGQPEGLVTTAAQAIDYQFGFKVSETWFYQFLRRALFWLAPLQVGLLILSTGLVIIEPGEQALLERFGRPVAGSEVLGPGPHLKLPWPVDKVYRFRTDQIQKFDVGFTEEKDHERDRAVLWTVAHTKEENFLIANRDPGSLQVTNQAGKRTPPVGLLTVSIPMQFQITNLPAWAYNNEDAPSLLQDLATREVVRYLAGVDVNDLMTKGRLDAGRTLVQRIQAAADERQLGARLISADLGDLHPPVKVAPDYEKVVGAYQGKQAKALAAQADAIRTNALAEAQATNILNNALADATRRKMDALARAGLFTNQLPAFAAAPSVYAERMYLQTFLRSTANARKYLMLTTNTHDVITINLEDSIARGILDVKIPEPKTPTTPTK